METQRRKKDGTVVTLNVKISEKMKNHALPMGSMIVLAGMLCVVSISKTLSAVKDLAWKKITAVPMSAVKKIKFAARQQMTALLSLKIVPAQHLKIAMKDIIAVMDTAQWKSVAVKLKKIVMLLLMVLISVANSLRPVLMKKIVPTVNQLLIVKENTAVETQPNVQLNNAPLELTVPLMMIAPQPTAVMVYVQTLNALFLAQLVMNAYQLIVAKDSVQILYASYPKNEELRPNFIVYLFRLI